MEAWFSSSLPSSWLSDSEYIGCALPERMSTGSDCAVGGVALRASRAMQDAFRIPCVNTVNSWKEQERKVLWPESTHDRRSRRLPGQRQNRNFLKEKLIEASTDCSEAKTAGLGFLGMDALLSQELAAKMTQGRNDQLDTYVQKAT